MDIEILKTKIYNDNDYRHGLAKKYAMEHTLHNGATLEFPEDGYRNINLLFWDAKNEEIVEPFTEIDDYGSVPPRFVVGDGYFSPHHWLEEVDHNSYIFPAKSLIDEMKEFATQHPNTKKMIVQINGAEYIVTYSPKEMKNKWDACILEGDMSSLRVYPGDPKWREEIVEDKTVVIEKPVIVEKLSDLEKLQKMVEELTKKVADLTTRVEELSTDDT